MSSSPRSLAIAAVVIVIGLYVLGRLEERRDGKVPAGGS